MKITCPHCSQHLELDPETIIALEGASHFDCPTCGGAVDVPAPVQVPAKQAAPRQKGKPTTGRVARQTQQGINRNLLVLGVVALLAIGGVALFLASKNGGNIFNHFENLTNEILNNTYFTQLIADGVTSKDDLKAIAEIRPYGEGFIGISKEALSWEQAQEAARKIGAGILEMDHSTAKSGETLTAWLEKNFTSIVSSTVWIGDRRTPGVLVGSEFLPVKGADGVRKAFFHWRAHAQGKKRRNSNGTYVCELHLRGTNVDVHKLKISSEGIESIANASSQPTFEINGKKWDPMTDKFAPEDVISSDELYDLDFQRANIRARTLGTWASMRYDLRQDGIDLELFNAIVESTDFDLHISIPEKRGGVPLPQPEWTSAWACKFYSYEGKEIPQMDEADSWRLVLEKELEELDLDWLSDPLLGVVPKDFVVLTAKRTFRAPPGRYRISTISDDGIRIRIDGSIVLENWTGHTPTQDSAEFSLPEKENNFQLDLDYFEWTHLGTLKVYLQRIE